ncbi:MAG: glycosyltransferase [Bacteroidota bacterium]
MSTHIAIVTGSPLCRNPRVVKEASALAEAGFRVAVFRPVFSRPLAELDRALVADAAWAVETTVDLTAQRVWPRLVRRASIEAVRRGVERPEALGYGLRRTLALARAADADLTIGHQEVGLWVVNRLGEAGRRVGFDLEDWYAEDLLPEARRSRPLDLLRREEALAVRRGGHVTTTSDALAAAFAAAYDGPSPTTVYNAFPWADRAALDGETKDRLGGDRQAISLHWVSQRVGPGRGLETVCDALHHVETPVELHLRGLCDPDTEAALRARLPADRGHTLHLHDPVPPDELLSRIAEHDIGLALEAPDPPSRDLTVTNKILHYLLAGLPVVATDTAGQREIAHKAPDAVSVFPSGDARRLGAAIEALAADPEVAGRAALAAAEREFSWEVQRATLVSSVERALQSAVPRR